MLAPHEGQRDQDQDRQKFGPCDRTPHDEKYPFISEFSEFIASVSTESLEKILMTQQQRQLAKAIWEAENYGGSESKCIARLKEIYGPNWRQLTTVAQHMEPLRKYYEHVLILEHQNQWEHAKKLAKIP
jgi:DNA-binding PadR family transcriptional regulator